MDHEAKLFVETRKAIKVQPEHRAEIIELYTLAMGEIEDGGVAPDTRFGKWLAWADNYAERVDPLLNQEAFRVAY
jgi:hypothetical protein